MPPLHYCALPALALSSSSMPTAPICQMSGGYVSMPYWTRLSSSFAYLYTICMSELLFPMQTHTGRRLNSIPRCTSQPDDTLCSSYEGKAPFPNTVPMYWVGHTQMFGLGKMSVCKHRTMVWLQSLLSRHVFLLWRRKQRLSSTTLSLRG